MYMYIQVLRGGIAPALCTTKSAAHMDILMPDHFFRYWHTPAHRVPHPWYRPPIDLSHPAAAAAALPAWDARVAKVYWRGSVDEWAMSARGRLCRLAVKRRDLFDVEPLRSFTHPSTHMCYVSVHT